MKVKIEYEYTATSQYPYCAFTRLQNGDYRCLTSKVSFEDAKSQLVTALKLNDKAMPTIPQPEEVEI